MSSPTAAFSPGRLGTYAVALVIGVLYGVVATVGHRHVIRIGDVVIPWGLVAALGGVLALLLGIRLVAGGRAVAAAAAVGVVGAVALLTLPGFGASVLIAGDTIGTIWSIGPALIAVLVVAWPNLPVSSRDEA
ncbi:hypothetical protein [Agromyces sp. Marseille-P2726]|uniref:hypothetical protein n=1 Tax=Agromyces sp. Marseille-P2726 TaxID=2709132 RepID=UPI00156E5379|nr:hypothetical protein [Agromyces sp. Marseille-P2726]